MSHINRYSVFFLLLLLLSFQIAAAQELPFRKEIENFKRQDRLKLPPDNAILFVGSSSFRLWKDIDSCFPGKQIINRGFGGSTLEDVIRYAPDIVFPYHPRQIVIYCGENDIAENMPAEEVFDRFKTLFEMTRKKLGNVSVVYVSIKPSPSRARFREEVKKVNELIKAYLEKEPETAFVNVHDLMLNENNKPLPHLFVSDSLHMSTSGYAIWKEAIAPHLK